MKWLAVAMLWAFSSSATLAATEIWPSLYDVSGVASDDVLNVRAGPSVSTEIVGALAHDATEIEVVAIHDTLDWGLVNIGERSGWVSMRFMSGIPRLSGSFPPITSCYGTEPFWDFTLKGDTVRFSRLAEPDTPAFSVQRTGDIWTLTRFGLASDEFTAIIRHESCGDGMSDRAFGLSVDVQRLSDGDWQQYSGCCTLQP